uniref:ribonuclease H n=1 Tax=Buteo japonicus TaxID=224669 RepID=A0A8C0BSY0_9AVES
MIELEINLEIKTKEIAVKLFVLTTEDEAKINPEVWYTPESVGRLNIAPFEVTIKNLEIPIRVKQYPMSQKGRHGLQPVIERLLQQGLLEPCMSPHNTPILPIKKSDGSYRLVQDLREVNKRTVTGFPVVANPYTLLSHLSLELKWYSVIDLKDAFWACPLKEEWRNYFAFEWEDPETHRKQQLRWTVLPQGFTESHNLFGQALEQVLETFESTPEVTLAQYVDDLLLAGEDQETVRNESIRLLNFLSLKGFKVSKSKLQFTEEEVKYLGHWLSKGTKKLDPERVNGILSLQAPTSKRQIRQLLGLLGHCRQWIENYSNKVKFLYQKLVGVGLIKWTQKDEQSLESLKADLVNALVLSSPDIK